MSGSGLAPVPVATEAAEAIVERASATPLSSHIQRAESRSGAKASTSAGLDTLERWFLDAVSHPGSLASGLRAASRRHGVPACAVSGWLGVYHHGYRARLVECLADDYPAVRHVLGEERFERLCERVIARRPSGAPNLNAYGASLLAEIQSPIRLPHREFLRELAALEWAVVEAVHAAPPVTIDANALRAIPPERWGDLRFSPNPALRVLRGSYPVNPWFQAFRRGEPGPVPARKPSVVAVYRVGPSVWRMDLSAMTASLLDRLVSGVPLGEALAPVEGHAEAGQVMRWFEAWVGGGFFSNVS